MYPSVKRFLRREAVFLLAVFAGIALRWYQLGDQIVADDEWHALHSVRDHDLFTILLTFGKSDHCIPLTAFYKLAADTVGLSEALIRAPVFVAGLGALVVFPLLVRQYSGPRVAAIFAWLLAISPIHVYFSRYARPYSIALLFAFTGLMSFHGFLRTGRPAWKWLYAACAILGPYFHLSVAAVLLLPLGFALVRPNVRGLALIVLAGSLVLIAPPALHDPAALAGKLAHARLNLTAFELGWQLLLGISTGWLVVSAVMVHGALRCRDRRLAIYLCALVGLQLLVYVITRPLMSSDPITVARYNLTALPIALWALALGLDDLGARLARFFRPAVFLFPALCLLGMFRLGSIPDVYFRTNNFTHHALYQYFPTTDSLANGYGQKILFETTVPTYYEELSLHPENTMRILEAPWRHDWDHIVQPAYQRVHRQSIYIGFVDDPDQPRRLGEVSLRDGRFRFRRFVHVLDHDGLCARRIDHVVFHKDPAVAGHIAAYRERYGSPYFSDDQIVVFDVGVHCSRR
jgi:hypothetical protein